MKYQELLAYKKSFELAMSIFEVSKSFPKEETYALTDQIRRSSRSVSANISEAYRKRRYEKHFLSKLSDSDAENAETQTWLEYALACNYLDREIYNLHLRKSIEVGNLIGYMMRNPAKFIYGE
jgi:four helix bundle protein